MCIVSMVYDRYNPWLPEKVPDPLTPEQVDNIKRTIEDFFRDKTDAERLDKTLGQPDCADPEKAKLEERVRELEAALKEERTIGWRVRARSKERRNCAQYVLVYGDINEGQFTWVRDLDRAEFFGTKDEAKNAIAKIKEFGADWLPYYNVRLVRVLRK